jgi:rhodanese-related sulfurtransferase
MMKTILNEELANMRDRDEDLVLINVLGADQFEQEHIPGSTNVPVSRGDFVDAVRAKVGDIDRTIVVYCASESCDASPQAAKKLEAAGFTNVIDFAGGMKEWKQAARPVEHGAKSRTGSSTW